MGALLDALLLANNLKSVPRSGWVMRGVPEAESVADHTFGVAFVALALAQALGTDTPLDRGKLLSTALLHDLAESLTGDIPLPARRFLPEGAKRAAEHAAMQRLLGSLPGGEGLLALWEEYENRAGPEARLVRDADRIEILIQAYVYMQRTGNRTLAEFWDHLPGDEPFAFDVSQDLYADLRSQYEQQFEQQWKRGIER